MNQPTNIYDVRVLGGVFGTCALASPGGGVIAAGTNTTVFVDNLNVATTSGVIQTNSTGNQFGGVVNNGEQLTLFGLQIGVFTYLTATGVSQALPVVDCQELITKCSIELNARGNVWSIGAPLLYPSGGKGAYAPGAAAHAANGSPDAPVFRLPASMPLQLESQDQFSARVIVDTACTVTAASQFSFLFYFPATRAYTFRSLGGA